MRTPRPNFVVEYKTNRRQVKPRGTSIWGSLDLQAVARQIEVDGMVPGDLANAGTAPRSLTPDSASPVSILESQPEPHQHTLSSGGERMPEQSPDVGALDDQTTEAALMVPAQDDNSAKPVPGRAQVRKGRGAKRAPPIAPKLFRTEDDDTAPSVLALLEADNRYLKRLMMNKLREENEWMMSRLNRLPR